MGRALPRRAHDARWSTRASWRARRGRRRDRGRDGRRRPHGRGRGRAARRRGRARRAARRARQRLRAQARHPGRPVAACALLPRRGAADRPRRGRRARLPRDPQRGAGLRRQPDRQRQPAAARHRGLRLRRLRALATWKPARWTVTVDGETLEFDGYSVAVSNSGVYGSGMYLVPDARLDDGLLDVVLDRGQSRSAATSPACRRCSRAPTWTSPASISCGPRASFHADRPFTAYADGDPIADLPATVDVVPGTLRVLAP